MTTPIRACAGLLVVLCGVLGGCSFSGGPLTAHSVESTLSLELSPTVRAYRALDQNTADIYLTDIPEPALALGTSLEGVSGQIVHLRLFVSPEAGSTPIDQTACSVSIRLVVVSQGEVGIYGGGGFLFPDDDPGSSTLDGNVEQATMKFIASTEHFADRLGPSELSGSVSAPKDAALAQRLSARMDEIASLARARQTVDRGERVEQKKRP